MWFVPGCSRAVSLFAGHREKPRPNPGGVFDLPQAFYRARTTLVIKRERTMPACAQVILAWGESVLAEVPVISPVAAAQDMAGCAAARIWL